MKLNRKAGIPYEDEGGALNKRQVHFKLPNTQDIAAHILGS